MNCKLTRIKSNHNHVRTDEIIGQCEDKPVVGQIFVMTGPPLDPTKDIRAIWTTPVLEVIEISDTKMEFKTMNSHYGWEELEHAVGESADIF